MGMHRHRQHRVDFMEWAPGIDYLGDRSALLVCYTAIINTLSSHKRMSS